MNAHQSHKRIQPRSIPRLPQFLLVALMAAASISPALADTNLVLSLDGNSGYVTVPSAADLQNPSEITIEAWVYPQRGNQNNTLFINKSDNAIATSSRSYEMQWVADADSAGPGNSVRFIVFLSSGSWAVVSAPAPENTWLHIAGCFSSSQGVLQLFTNGVIATSTTTDAGGSTPLTGTLLRQTTLPVRLGRGDVAPYYYARGLMDEVRIWSAARTQAEIAGSMSCRLMPSGGRSRVACILGCLGTC